MVEEGYTIDQIAYVLNATEATGQAGQPKKPSPVKGYA